MSEDKRPSTQWYYTKDGSQLGPVTGSQLRRMAATGELLPTDLVIKEGGSKWTPASELKPSIFPETDSRQSPPRDDSARHDSGDGDSPRRSGSGVRRRPRDDDDDDDRPSRRGDVIVIQQNSNKGVAIVVEIVCSLFLVFGIGHFIRGNTTAGVIFLLVSLFVDAVNLCLVCLMGLGFFTWPVCWLIELVVSLIVLASSEDPEPQVQKVRVR